MYRLNSLVRAAFARHGTVPVLLTLGQLLHDARSSFIHIPCQELCDRVEGDEYKLLSKAEVDIVCIKDGQFILGDVKQSVELFGDADFTKMEGLARALKPDVILFSSLNQEPNRLVKDNIDRLKASLAELEIDINWYPIH